MRKKFVISLISLFYALILQGQVCINPGQTPSSAFKLCGSAVHVQPDVPHCGQLPLPVPCSGGFVNRNPYWFKMNCYVAGTLGFVISPGDPASNYDWQLFDITGRNDDDVFTDPTLFIACNWSSDPGDTGASQDGVSSTECPGPGKPTFSKMPLLIVGHEYILLVSSFDGLPGGFQLSLEGGSAVIADPFPASLALVQANCDASVLTLRTTKPVRCNSIASDGSDFIIPGYSVVSAFALNCGPTPFADAIQLILNAPMANGNYQLIVQSGTDGNPLLDMCDREIPAGSQLPFTVTAPLPTPMDSVQVKKCEPAALKLVFKKPIVCATLSTGEFSITGPAPVNISNILTNCNTNNPPSFTEITLRLSTPLTTAGNYQVQLSNGTDGNTLIDECGKETAPASLPFTIVDAVDATFSYQLKTSCKTDTLSFFHPGGNGISSWSWSFDNTTASNLQNPVKLFTDTGRHSIRLIVSNGGCSDTTLQIINLQNKIKADFSLPPAVCPGDMVILTNKSSGRIDNWRWDMGAAINSSLQTPVPWQYPVTSSLVTYQVRLIAGNSNYNCYDTTVKTIKALKECYATVPSAFTPNNDGLNDYLYPLLAAKADNMEFRIYNKVGQLVFMSNNASQKWDGKFQGLPQDTGLFVWMLHYTHRDTGEKIFLKGTTLLIR